MVITLTIHYQLNKWKKKRWTVAKAGSALPWVLPKCTLRLHNLQRRSSKTFSKREGLCHHQSVLHGDHHKGSRWKAAAGWAIGRTVWMDVFICSGGALEVKWPLFALWGSGLNTAGSSCSSAKEVLFWSLSSSAEKQPCFVDSLCYICGWEDKELSLSVEPL